MIKQEEIINNFVCFPVSSHGSSNKVWVDTVTDLNQYKPSAEELETRKLARKSNNKLLAKVEFRVYPHIGDVT